MNHAEGMAAIIPDLEEEFTPTMDLRWSQCQFHPEGMSVRLMNNHGFMANPKSRYRLEQKWVSQGGTVKWVPVPFE